MPGRSPIIAGTGFLFLLLILVLRFALFSTFIQTQKERFRLDALLNPGKEVTQLSIPLARLYADGQGLEWKEKNREVVINGQYYEVLRVEITGKSVQLTLLEDEQENRLFTEFFRMKEDQKLNLSALSSLIFGLQFTPDPSTLIMPPSPLRAAHTTDAEKRITEGHLQKAVRPPAALPEA
jgi:hypothetical protein